MYANKNNVQINMNRQEAALLLGELNEIFGKLCSGPAESVKNYPSVWELKAVIRFSLREEE